MTDTVTQGRAREERREHVHVLAPGVVERDALRHLHEALNDGTASLFDGEGSVEEPDDDVRSDPAKAAASSVSASRTSTVMRSLVRHSRKHVAVLSRATAAVRLRASPAAQIPIGVAVVLGCVAQKSPRSDVHLLQRLDVAGFRRMHGDREERLLHEVGEHCFGFVTRAHGSSPLRRRPTVHCASRGASAFVRWRFPRRGGVRRRCRRGLARFA